MHDIDAEDSVSFSNLEASLPIPEYEHLRIRMRGSKASGAFNQSVPAGDLIRIENTRFFGPVDFSGTTDVTYFSIAIGSDYTRGEYLSGDLRGFNYIGIAQTNLDSTLLITGTTYQVDDITTEFYLQSGLAYSVSKSMEFGLTLAYSANSDTSGVTEVDLKLDYELLKQLRITAGYRWFEYRYKERPVDSDDSDIIVDFAGPFVGLNIPF